MSISLTKTVSAVTAVSGDWTVTVGDVAGIYPGVTMSVRGMPDTSWDANNVTVTAVDSDLLTVEYSHGNHTEPATTVDGIILLHVAWIDTAYVTDALGFTPAGTDADYLAECVTAANEWAFSRRQAAGYLLDRPNYAPNGNAKLGTGLYAMALYRERGSVDSFASFDPATAGPVGTSGQINRLLGIGRARVG